MTISVPTQAFREAKWIVSATAGQGTHTTIAGAITAASSGDTIFIRPGTYTENLTLKSGVSLVSYDGQGLSPTVTIVGKSSYSGAGNVTISGIRLQTNSDFILSITGSGTVNYESCYFNCTNGSAISRTSGSGTVNVYKCQGDLGTTGIYFFDASGSGGMSIEYSVITNSGLSLTASGTSATVLIKYSQLAFPISCSSGGFDIVDSDIQCQALNQTAFSSSGGGGISSALNTGFHSGTASAINWGAGHTLNLVNCAVESSNANAIAGFGTINYTPIAFQGSSSTIQNSVALSLLGFGPSNATSGYVWTSTGAFTNPTWQAASASGAITTITGNTGGAESPSAGNFNVVGTGSITVAGTANTETVQLTGLTNHNVQVGAGTATLTQVAPSATAGIPLVSNGSSSDPSFTTAVVAGGGTGATSFTANGAVISNTTTTGALAAVALTNQQLLVGNTSAAPTAKSISVNIQTFTSSGTYTPTSGMIYCIIECVGNGGGGGGTANAAASTFAGGGGGGGGGYSRKFASAATIGSSQTVTIGATGSGGTSGNNAGTSGGDVSVGSICIGKGGTGGGGNSGSGAASGGAGGVAGTGDFTVPGAKGSYFITNGGNATNPTNSGGAAGLGFGAGGLLSTNSTPQTGQAGSNYGGGGSGGISFSGAGAAAGGAGATGIAIVTEYIIA